MINKIPKYKGQPQKHVVVCQECRRRKAANHTKDIGSPSCLLIFEKRSDPR